MAAPAGPFVRVAEIIERAEAQGCRLREPGWTLVTPFGEFEIRYLYNPLNGGRFDISDFEDDELMAPSTIRAAERRLFITLIDQS